MFLIDQLEMASLVLAQVVPPNPDAELPPELAAPINRALGILKGVLIVGSVGGLLICALMIVFGRRNRNQMAMEGVMGSAWVAGGLALGSAAAGIVGVFI
jgi:hypothetical protein